MKNLFLGLILAATLKVEIAYGVNFGKRSMTFPIQEEGFVEMMMRKLKDVNLAEENEKMKKIAKDRVENPVAVEGLRPAKMNRIFHFDPSFILDEDAVLPCGKVLYKAGTKVNPLDHMSLDRRLFFVDGREKNQLQWLKQVLSEMEENQNVENRIILVGGSVFKVQEDLKEIFGKEIFFDQMGELTNRFGIKASPAVAVQEGKLLKIEEFKLTKEMD